MAGESDLHRDLGRLEGRLTSVEIRMADSDRRTEAALKTLQEGIDSIHERLVQSAMVDAGRVGSIKGAWWIITAMLSFAGAIGGLVAWLIKSYFGSN